MTSCETRFDIRLALRIRTTTALFLVVGFLAVFATPSCGDSSDPDSSPAVDQLQSDRLAVTGDGSVSILRPDTNGSVDLGTADSRFAPVWTPNGQQLAFMSDARIYLGRPDSELRVLPEILPHAQEAIGLALPSSASFSPDGLLLAVAIDGERGGIWIVDLLSDESRKLISGPIQLGGWWNPGNLDTRELVVVDGKTNTAILIDPAARIQRLLFSASLVVPSPSDERIAFVRDTALYAWSHLRDGSSLLLDAGAPIVDVQWSPMGGQLAVVVQRSAQDSQIWIVSSGAGEESPRFVSPGSSPSWRPDGAGLAFEHDGNLLLTDLSSSVTRQLGAGRNPVWEPPSFNTGVLARTPDEVELAPALWDSSSFEDGLGGWEPTGSVQPIATISSADSFRGDKAVEIRFTGDWSWFAAPAGRFKASLEGSQWTLSAWVKTSVFGVYIGHVADHSVVSDLARSESHPGDGKWHRLILTFSPEYDVGGTTTFIDLGITSSSEGIVLLDAVQFEQGILASPYHPLVIESPLAGLEPAVPIALD